MRLPTISQTNDDYLWAYKRTDYFKSFDDLKIELPKEYRREFFAEGQMFYFYKRNKTQRLWSNESMLMDEGLYIIPNPDTDF